MLPKRALNQRCFDRLLDSTNREHIGFDDFRANGLLLPAQDSAAIRMALPLHRGPHRDYNAMVMERLGQIEQTWAARRLADPEAARDEAVMRLRLLQGALRRMLLDSRRHRVLLNRHDPLGTASDFSELDAMAEMLWGATEPAQG